MNGSEFNQLRQTLERCIGGFSEWLARGRDRDEQSAVLTEWADALRDVAMDDAKSAVKGIMRGDVEKPAFGDLPATIRRQAKLYASERLKRPKRKTDDGQELVDCLQCLDQGFVICYHPQAIADYVKNGAGAFVEKKTATQKEPRRVMPKFATCAVPCSCRVGIEKQKKDGPIYDKFKWIRVTAISTQEQIDELTVGVDERMTKARRSRVESHPNYDPRFAAYNAGEDF